MKTIFSSLVALSFAFLVYWLLWYVRISPVYILYGLAAMNGIIIVEINWKKEE